MPFYFSPLRSHSYARSRFGFLMFILWHSPKNEPRKRAKGCSPWIPRGFALPTRQGSKGLLSICLHLGGIIAPPRWVGRKGAMLCLGKFAAYIAKLGEAGLKPFWKTEEGKQCATVVGKSLDFPTQLFSSHATSAQPRKNVWIACAFCPNKTHFCLGAWRDVGCALVGFLRALSP